MLKSGEWTLGHFAEASGQDLVLRIQEHIAEESEGQPLMTIEQLSYTIDPRAPDDERHQALVVFHQN